MYMFCSAGGARACNDSAAARFGRLSNRYHSKGESRQARQKVRVSMQRARSCTLSPPCLHACPLKHKAYTHSHTYTHTVKRSQCSNEPGDMITDTPVHAHAHAHTRTHSLNERHLMKQLSPCLRWGVLLDTLKL